MATIRSSSQCFVDPASSDPLQGFQFGITTRELLFSEAGVECRNLEGGDIASIHSSAENDAVIQLYREDARNPVVGVWIGLVDSIQTAEAGDTSTNRFSWTDGSEFNFGTVAGELPWSAFSPNNNNGVEHCAQLVDVEEDDGNDLVWNDANCNAAKPVICRSNCTLATSSTPTLAPSVLLSETPSSSPTTNKMTSASSDFRNTHLFTIIGGMGIFLLLIGLVVTNASKKRANKKRRNTFGNLKMRVIDTSNDPNKVRLWGQHRPSGLILPEKDKHGSFLRVLQWRKTASTIYPPTAAFMAESVDEEEPSRSDYLSWATTEVANESNPSAQRDFSVASNPRYRFQNY